MGEMEAGQGLKVSLCLDRSYPSWRRVQLRPNDCLHPASKDEVEGS